MGRKKIELKRIECPKERANKYSKRKKGLLKKGDEIATLCGVDVAMVLFSPSDKPTLFHTRSRSLSQILNEFSKISLAEREERRAYTTKTLEKLVSKNNTEVPIEIDNLSPERDKVTQDDEKVTELRELKEQLNEKESMLRDWKNPDRVDDLERLNIMEKHIKSSLSQVRKTLKVKIQEELQTSQT